MSDQFLTSRIEKSRVPATAIRALPRYPHPAFHSVADAGHDVYKS